VIPLRDQQLIRERFGRELTSRLRIDFFTQKPSPIFVPGRDCARCEDARTLLRELASLSSRISLTIHDLDAEAKAAAGLGVDRVPGIVLRGQSNRALRFFGLPAGTLFPVFLEAMIEAAQNRYALDDAARRQLRKLKSDVTLDVYVAPHCPYSSATMHAAFKLALENVRVLVRAIDVTEFPASAQRFAMRAVPLTVLDEAKALPGLLDERALAANVLLSAEGRPLQPGPGPVHVTPLQVQTPEQRTVRTSPSGLIIPR